VTDPCYSPRIRRLSRRVLPLVYRGAAVCCPCCGGTFRKFIARYGDDALCPGCLSLQRHRALSLFLPDRLSELDGEIALLHFAPEEGLAEKLRSLPRVRYLSADLDPRSPALMHFDITAIPFDDASFDAVVCNHVLEHVENDRQAMRELCRVLKPGSYMYSIHPVHRRLAATVEDPSVTDPKERRRLFGQFDHVRRYGRDFADRLTDAGFEVNVENYGVGIEPERLAYFGLAEEEPIFVCRRPVGA
jgi:SAM-dependent methyltransferase